MTSWWLNQPLWKMCSSKWESSPNFRGENKKYLKPPPRWSSFYSSSFFKPWPFDPPKWRSLFFVRPEKITKISSETRSLRRSWLINSSHFNKQKRQGILRMKILNMSPVWLRMPLQLPATSTQLSAAPKSSPGNANFREHYPTDKNIWPYLDPLSIISQNYTFPVIMYNT